MPYIPYEEIRITIEHVRTGKTGFHDYSFDPIIPPHILHRDIHHGVDEILAQMAFDPWYRLPEEEGEL
jgi:hypothetical protein